MAQQRVTIEIPDGYSQEDREKIARDIVQFIRDRCAQGQGVRPHGNHYRTYSFPEYSAKYKKIKGSSRVDLVLNDEMLADLDVLFVGRNQIAVGYQSGTDSNAKAEGNQTGSYGQPNPNPRKARRFLGMTNEELNAVLAAYDKGDD